MFFYFRKNKFYKEYIINIYKFYYLINNKNKKDKDYKTPIIYKLIIYNYIRYI